MNQTSKYIEYWDTGDFLRLMDTAMASCQVDAQAVYARCGVRQEYLDDPSFRFPHTAQASFWHAAELESGDLDIGLHLGEKMPLYSGRVLEYLFLSSPTFGEGLLRASRFRRLVSDAVRADYSIEGDTMWLRFDSLSPEISQLRHTNEIFALGLIRFFKSVTNDAFELTKVEFSHSKPDNTAEHARLFQCDVAFAAEESRIYFPAKVLNHSSTRAEPRLLQLHEQVAQEYIAQLESRDTITAVKLVIGERLESGDVTLAVVAERLNMTVRELRQRLQEANMSFNTLLAEYRCRLARRLLARTDESIDEIVYLTGFAEPSTFYRAFKRWVGETPIEYRKRKRLELKQQLSSS